MIAPVSPSSGDAAVPALAMVSPPLSVRSVPPAKKSRGPIVVLLLLFVLALAAASWLVFVRMRHR
jgi:hypothetical protein